MSKQNLSYSGCTGERGLIVAVITQAVKDATGRNEAHKAAAQKWFVSEQYRAMLTALGLPPDWMPVVLNV